MSSFIFYLVLDADDASVGGGEIGGVGGGGGSDLWRVKVKLFVLISGIVEKVSLNRTSFYKKIKFSTPF